MGLTRDVFISVIWVLVLAFLAWWVFGWLLCPVVEQKVRVVIPGRGEGSSLEQSVRRFIWLRGLGLLNCPIVIADVDLTPQGWELALRLTARWPDVALWPAGQLADYIARDL